MTTPVPASCDTYKHPSDSVRARMSHPPQFKDVQAEERTVRKVKNQIYDTDGTEWVQLTWTLGVVDYTAAPQATHTHTYTQGVCISKGQSGNSRGVKCTDA